MKIEYIASGAIDTPLIRLYDFGRDGAFTLHLAVNDLASGVRDQVELQCTAPGFLDTEQAAIVSFSLSFYGPRSSG